MCAGDHGLIIEDEVRRTSWRQQSEMAAFPMQRSAETRPTDRPTTAHGPRPVSVRLTRGLVETRKLLTGALSRSRGYSLRMTPVAAWHMALC